MDRELRRLGVTPGVRFRSDDNATLLGLAATSTACALVPVSVAAGRDESRAVRVPLGGLLPPRRIGIVAHADRSLPSAARALIACARRAAAAWARPRTADVIGEHDYCSPSAPGGRHSGRHDRCRRRAIADDRRAGVRAARGRPLYDRGVDGSECQWARVLAYESPNRVVFSWDIDPRWQIETNPEKTSEVEVRFIAETPERTRVELEHRHLDRHGDGWEQTRDSVAGEAAGPAACGALPSDWRPGRRPRWRRSVSAAGLGDDLVAAKLLRECRPV
jgi:LysR substrate binding domain/Activator of Hsp90 ATPase homolog 1-like protein